MPYIQTKKKTPVVQEENVMEYYGEEYIYLNLRVVKFNNLCSICKGTSIHVYKYIKEKYSRNSL